MATVNPIPSGLHTLTPQLSLDGAAEAIALYQQALGAEERSRALDPSGTRIWHAELRIGDSVFFVNDTFPEMGSPAHPTELCLYTDKAEALFRRAVAAGMTVVMPMTDMFWGDRTGTLADRWGNRWTIGQRTRDLTPEQMKKAGEEFVQAQRKRGGAP